jgi:hypothetical protein
MPTFLQIFIYLGFQCVTPNFGGEPRRILGIIQCLGKRRSCLSTAVFSETFDNSQH